MGLPSNVMLILGDGDDLLTTIILAFLIFMSIPLCFPASLHASNSLCKSFGQKHKRALSSAYLKLLMLMPFIVAPLKSSTSLNIFSVYKLRSLGDSTQPYRTPCLISSSFDTHDSVRTAAD